MTANAKKDARGTLKDTTKRIYIAGASANIELHEHLNSEVVVAGWEITCDWCAAVRAAGGIASPDDPLVRREAALADLEGVATADVFWLVQPDPTSTSTGSWVEIGAAITRRDLLREFARKGLLNRSEFPIGPTVVVSGASRKCIFADLCDYRFQEHDDALDFIKRGLVAI